jgi:BMFP domain-containing protein YqiC
MAALARTENDKLRERVAGLEGRLSALEGRVARLEADAVKPSPPL